MPEEYDVTFGVPRFLSFIELGYLLEAVKVCDAQLESKIVGIDVDVERNYIGNINATRQSFLRSAFISACAIFEQHLDEIANMEKKRKQIQISPSDLKGAGIKRSVNYAKKALGYDIDLNDSHWKYVLAMQEVRNHLVHYGPNFSETKEHKDRYNKFSKLENIDLRPMICFSANGLEKIFEKLMVCVEGYSS